MLELQLITPTGCGTTHPMEELYCEHFLYQLLILLSIRRPLIR